MRHGTTTIAILAGFSLMALAGCTQPNTYNNGMRQRLYRQEKTLTEQEKTLQKKDAEIAQRDSVINKMVEQIDSLRKQLATAPIVHNIVTPKIDDSDVTVEQRGNDIVITVAGDVLFKKARWDLSNGSRKVLNKIVSVINKQYPDRTIRVAGHTDSDPVINTKKTGLKDNMELSFRRADAVMKYMESKGLDKKRMYIAAYGETQPRASNATVAGKARNRRVEIIILPNIDVREETIEVSKK